MAMIPRGMKRRDNESAVAWLFAAPALVFYAAFVLWPLVLAVQYSFYDWNGIGPSTAVGFENYARILTNPTLLAPIGNALLLILFFTAIPVSVGLALASLLKTTQIPVFGGIARTVLFLPQIIPLAAAGIAWGWMYSQSGVINQLLGALGLGFLARPWLGDFDTALPAVGLIGSWTLTGLCTVMFLTGIAKIDASLYESARIDGASWFSEFRAVTLPGLRNEVGVLVTLTMIAALASFAIIFSTTRGGPGGATSVPSIEIYRLGFGEREIGLASALGVLVMLLVLAIILPVQQLFRDKP